MHKAGSERGNYLSQMDHFTSEKLAHEKSVTYLLQNCQTNGQCTVLLHASRRHCQIGIS